MSPAQAWGVYNSHVQIHNYYEREDVASLLVHNVVDEVLAADRDVFEVEISVQVAPSWS